MCIRILWTRSRWSAHLVLPLAAAAQPALAAPIASDSFTYDTSGSAELNGKNGGTG